MSTTYLRSSIKDLYTAYSKRQKNIEATMPNGFRLYNAEVQASMIDTERKKIQTEFKGKAVELQKKIASERKQVRLDIGRVRFPGLTSKDPGERAIAETQINSALLFLSTPHSSEAIASALRDAIDLKRNDFAFTLIDNVLAGIPKDISGQDKPSEAQKVLLNEIADIENSFNGKAKLDELQAELKGMPILETIANEFKAQIDAGEQAIALPELFPDLNDNERNEMIRNVDARGNVAGSVNFKRRVSESMRTYF